MSNYISGFSALCREQEVEITVLKKEIARLREENAELKRWDALREAMVAAAESLKADNARLREAIRREAHFHTGKKYYDGGKRVPCPCEICRIAREGR